MSTAFNNSQSNNSAHASRSLEGLIAQANAAHSAGVFETTRVDFSSLIASPGSSRLIRFYERALVGLPVAACLGIMVGITSMMGGPTGQSSSVFVSGDSAVSTLGLNEVGLNDAAGLNGMVLNGMMQAAGSGIIGSFEAVTQCFAGPGEAVSSDCGFADLDSDGDVDLADLGSYQQQVALVN
ncbi:MAG: hypothetical protein GXP29_06370 [Planctomycetes bacterium]|nr:hypothetical protein [Planctomycetota bacterium]